MALSVTLAQLRTRVRQRADIENDTHVSDTELNTYINDAITHLWDMLVMAAEPDYYRQTVTLTLVPGQLAYALSSVFPAGNFYKIRQVYVQDGDRLRPIDPLQGMSVQPTVAPRAAEVLTIHYIPCATRLSLDADTFDGINGWEELVVVMAAIDVKTKREEDASLLSAKKTAMESRIASMAYRDAGSPQKVNKRRYRRRDPFYGMSTLVSSYRLTAGYIEVYQDGYY